MKQLAHRIISRYQYLLTHKAELTGKEVDTFKKIAEHYRTKQCVQMYHTLAYHYKTLLSEYYLDQAILQDTNPDRTEAVDFLGKSCTLSSMAKQHIDALRKYK